MTQEIKTEKFEGLLVKVPDEAYDFKINKWGNGLLYADDESEAPFPPLITLPQGQWKLIGNPFELSENQASVIVQKELIGGIGGVGAQWLSPDYGRSNCDGFDNPVSSFNSLLKSLHVFKENPYKNKVSSLTVFGFGDKDILEKFKQAEERNGSWVLIQKI